MKHPTLHDVDVDVTPFAADALSPATLTRAQKRDRWAQILEAHRGRVRAFDSIELVRPPRRGAMRADGSAVALAFADPVLRRAGLTGDSYADARGFFDLSHGDMHRLLCRCHIGASEPASATAARVRRLGESPLATVGRAWNGLARTLRARFV
jgi:hypothetical protein